MAPQQAVSEFTADFGGLLDGVWRRWARGVVSSLRRW